MRSSSVRNLIVFAAIIGMVGCQSGPRWAWWKRDAAPDDTSLVARSAAPALPSAQTTAEAVGTPGAEPAAPPSSFNLAAAQAPAAAPASNVPASSAATIANAPIANYPTTATVAEPYGTMPSTAMTAAAAVIASPSSAAVAAPTSVGPYDPNSYQSLASSGADSNTAESDAIDGNRYAANDRYSTAAVDSNVSAQSIPAPLNASGSLPQNYSQLAQQSPPADASTTQSAAPSSVYQAAPPVAGALADIDAAGPNATAAALAATDRYEFAAPTIASPPTLAAAVPDPTNAGPVATDSATTIASAVNAGTVQVDFPPGQYRPGGTSSYIGNIMAGHIEVASRPTAPTHSSAAPVAAPNEGAQPAASTSSAPTSQGGLRYGTY
jgi:hypothetical protein